MPSFKSEAHSTRLVILIIILFFALAIRAFYFVGININDDTEYADAAFRIATGEGLRSYAIGSIDSIRFFMVIPVALFYRIFGISDITSSLYPLSCSILTILLAYLLAKKLFGWEVGIATALMLSLFPLDLVYCTQLVPTVPLACVLTGSLLCFIKGDILADEKEKHSLTKANLLFLFSGILIGIGWMINEPAPLFGIVICLYPLLNWKFRRGYLLFVAGAVGLFLAECIFFKIMTGDFFWRLTIIHEEEKRVLTNTAMDYYPTTFFKIKDISFPASQGHFGFFWYVFVASSLYLAVFRKKQSFFLLLGIWLILLYFQFGFMTLGGRPIAKWIRYMEMILPFVTMLASFALLSFGSMGRGKWKGWVLVFLFLLSNLWFIPKAVDANREHTKGMKRIATFLRELPGDKPVYIDAGAMGFVDIYLGKKREFRYLERSRAEAIQDAYVVINGSRGIVENKEMRGLLPSHGKNPPSSWKLLKRIEDAPINTAYGRFYPLIYYAPEGAVTLPAVASVDERGCRATGTGSFVKDSVNDTVCHSPGMKSHPDFIDILCANIYKTDDDVLVLEMELEKSPGNIGTQDAYTAYIWFLDMDQNADTGQAHGNLGAEFNIRVSRMGNENWGLYVDDNTPGDAYKFRQTSTSFTIKESVVQARVPFRAFSAIKGFAWEAESLIVNLKSLKSLDCHDYVQSGFFNNEGE